MAIHEIADSLSGFLTHNKGITARKHDDNTYILEGLWEDETIELFYRQDDEKLRHALNNIYLPPRYSAIYHVDTRRLEVLYTVFTSGMSKDEISSRSFDFDHAGHTYSCKFEKTSDRCMLLAKDFLPTDSITYSNFRNLNSYKNYAFFLDHKDDAPHEIRSVYANAEPISFWIDEIVWDDDIILDMIHHLNFYMSYFDRESPTILIHSPPDESRSQKKPTRYPFRKFPAHIKSVDIDRNLLHFWQASLTGDPARRFLYSYQIVEYASFYLLEEEIASGVRRLLASPDAFSRSTELTAQILETIGQSKISDPQKIEGLFKRVVKAERIWNLISDNKAAFCQPTKFEGGYQAPALVQEHWTQADFSTHWPLSFANALRGMRNALSHGREQRMTSVITPTANNMRKLQAWVPLIAASAREVMVYRNV